MNQYKIIDGIVYKVVDSEEIKNKLVATCEKVKPYLDGITESQKCIKAYQEQIEGYRQQISNIVNSESIDPEVAKMIDPERASMLGFQ